MNNRFLLLVTFVILIFSCQNNHHHVSYISGKVINRDSDTLILAKLTENARINPTYIIIQNDGTFKYKINNPHIEQYDLFFIEELNSGSVKPTRFFSEGKVYFELHKRAEDSMNILQGGELNEEFKNYNKRQREIFLNIYMSLYKINDSLLSVGDFYYEPMKKVNDVFNSAKKGENLDAFYNKRDSLKEINEDLSVNARLVANKLNKLNIEQDKIRYKYIKNNQTELGYALIILDLIKFNYIDLDLQTIINARESFIKKFPDHPYTEFSNNLISGLQNARVGGNYVNFSARNNQGSLIKLDSIIKSNKITLLDLWAPWCAPCIRKSKKMVPFYEAHKNEGFEIIGVIGGIKNVEKYQKALRKYNYPWTNLKEINRENKIWEKYNISMQGGSQFLIDNSGKILAINPETEIIEQLLSSE